ncbi:MAG: hypothetical protein EWV84_05640 [Microcystis sp. M_QC_C_20170808_M3Col]|nr:MAG: hypothetical protein EWV84_05640 [Microcystis sp. M_QC_C_20170808_M3Col]
MDRLLLLFFAITLPLSELKQKTDLLCLPKPELLILAIVDPFSGLTNAVDSSYLPNCDRAQIKHHNRLRSYCDYWK